MHMLDDNSLSLEMHEKRWGLHPLLHTLSRINKQTEGKQKGVYCIYPAGDNQPFNKQLHGNLF